MKKAEEISGTYADIAIRLRSARKYFGYKQKDFADMMSINPKSYSQWESGNFRISIQGALKLRERFNLSLDFIYCGSLDTLPHNIASALSESPLLNASSTSNVSKPD